MQTDVEALQVCGVMFNTLTLRRRKPVLHTFGNKVWTALKQQIQKTKAMHKLVKTHNTHANAAKRAIDRMKNILSPDCVQHAHNS